MKNKSSLLILGLAAILSARSANAAVTLPHVFGDNMVLQQQQPVPVWGWAAPGEKVTVEFAGQKRSAKADKSGRWEVRLRLPVLVSTQ